MLLALVAVAVAGAAWLLTYAVSPLRPGAGVDDTVVAIPSRAGLAGIQQVLVDAGVLRDDVRFRILARLFGRGRRLQAGEFRFGPGQTPLDVLRTLATARPVLWPVTVPEGANLNDVADILAGAGLVKRGQFLRLVTDRAFVRKQLGIDVPSLEGYLFPDTYRLSRSQDDAAIVGMMLARLREQLRGLGVVPGSGQVAQGLSLHGLLTLASIVEKETAVAAERPLIARVFLNRLAIGMRLQTDPTVIYGLVDFNGDLTRADLEKSTPYNTYLIKGLPPGPIANPGRAAIDAVLHPSDGAFLYFVAKNDGTHQFSATLAEHNRAVHRYQKLRRR